MTLEAWSVFARLHGYKIEEALDRSKGGYFAYAGNDCKGYWNTDKHYLYGQSNRPLSIAGY